MTFQITIEPLGATVETREDQTVLDACLRAGVWLPHACGHGLCATCKVQVIAGEYELGDASPFALMDFERDEHKILACCALAQSDLVIEADVDDDPDARHIPMRDFKGRVSEVVELTPTIRGIRIDLEEDALDFQAGQYVQVHIPGLDKPRAFSLANAPGTTAELHVRRVANGAGTTWLHDHLRVGDPLRFTGPMGRFFVRASDPQPLIFIAGGSGLSSPRSMILDRLAQGDERRMILMYGARSRAELYYHDEFLSLAQRHSNFRYLPVLSEPTAACQWGGETGYVHEAAQRAFQGDFRGHRAYLCGPPPMIEACISVLMQGRLFERDIFTEKFLTSADGEKALARSPLFRSL
jgi:phenol hydroxylase P5 protein